jgi:hypothetical protein
LHQDPALRTAGIGAAGESVKKGDSKMNRVQGLVVGCGVLGLLASAPPAFAQGTAPRAVTLQVGGTSTRGDFEGTITINRFQLDRTGQKIEAVGIVQGVLRRNGRAVGSVLVGEVTWPVSLRSGGVVVARGGAAGAPQVRSVSLSADAARGAGFVPVQATACQVLDIVLGANTIDLMGIQIALGPAVLSLAGATGTALGGLVCSVSDLIGNVAGLVDLVNSILGLLTGLLGGLTGGITPPVVPVSAGLG